MFFSCFLQENDSPMSLFSLGIGIISFGSTKLKLQHFNAKLVGMPRSLDHLLLFSISGVLTPYIGNVSFTNLKLWL